MSYNNYRTDKTVNQIITALNTNKIVLIVYEDEYQFNIAPITGYEIIKNIASNQKQYLLSYYKHGNSIPLSAFSLEEYFTIVRDE